MSSEVASIGVEEAWNSWVQNKQSQWERGRREYVSSPSEPFSGDAALEAAIEMVDFSNYADQMHREGRITDEERGHVESVAFEFYLWCHRVRQED